MNKLVKRIIELSYRNKLTHVSSCLNTVNLLENIYLMRKRDDPVVLGNSHAALALYVILEHNGLCDAEDMINKHGVHASRDMQNGIWVSGGSLGQPETIAVGMALSDRKKNVWLITSDGAMSEGSVWESLYFAEEQMLMNLHISIVVNGFGAYRSIDSHYLWRRCNESFKDLDWTFHLTEMPFPWLEGLDGHYLVISDEQYREAMA